VLQNYVSKKTVSHIFSILVFSCANEPGKSLCHELNGECVIQRDGYYYVSSLCVLVGSMLLVAYIAPTIRYLECKSCLPCVEWYLNFY
jgi:hypothetical protein